MAATVPTERIRSVVVLGHTGTGKTALVAALLRSLRGLSPADPRPLLAEDTEERGRGHTLSLHIATADRDGYRLNLLDTPGGAEVLGDVYPALLAADTAVFVVDATVGVQPQHEELWRLCETRGIPRVVFCNKLDLERADAAGVIAELRARHGRALAPVHLPFRHGDDFGIVDVLHGDAVESIDGQRVREPIPDDQQAAATAAREQLVEALVENDDELLARYLDGEEPANDELAAIFAHGIAEGGFFPVLCGSATTGIGVELLGDFLVGECPSPAEAPHPLPHDGPTVAAVVKTYADPYVGRINLLRLLAGQLRVDDELVVDRTGQRQRLHHLFRLCGREQLPTVAVAAGDLVAVAKLDDVGTGDLLCAEGATLDLEIPAPPPGFHRVVLRPVAVADEDKLTLALQRLTQEDPGIRIELDPVAGTRILAFQGPTHVEVTVERLASRAGVHVEVRPAPVDYRTTIRQPAVGIGRHVKQSGGHGQYGVVRLEVAPLGRGEGFRFASAIVGGVVPTQYVPSVEKGVRTAMRDGPLGGYPVVDIAVRLVDGKHHSVDSSDAAFQMAGLLGFRAAMAEADPVLLEPVVAVDVVVPEGDVGALLADLSARRGRILGTDIAGPSRSRVLAHVPEAEMVGFAVDLRALTGGRGELRLTYDHHDEVPDSVQRQVLDGAVAKVG